MRSALGIVSLFLFGITMGKAQNQANSLTPQEVKEGWKLLFDGRSMAGWEVHQAKNWSVQDGTLSCPADAASWLGTEDTYSDFHLRVQFKVPAKANSGVFLRSQKEGPPASTGYELQIWDFRPTGFNTGSLVDSIEAEPTKILADKWNQYDVTVQGNHFVIVLNGKQVLDGHDNKHMAGVIGLQCNPDHNPVAFQGIKVLSLRNPK